MGNNIMGMAAKPNHGKSKQTRNRRRANVQFEDLPEEVLCTILSKLPTKEAVRTCVLSSKWRSTWMIFPKLRFNGVAMLGHNRYQGEEYCRKFIDNVNTVLQQLHGNVVELDVKFEFNSMLVDHLNSWVSFVVSSRTQKLAFDLVPAKLGGLDDKYNFPFELFDSERISCLHHIQLSFVSLKLPSQFRGFPNLRKLDLHYLHVTRKDLQAMLSNCCNLEWLSIARCHLDDELKVDRPLYRLLHLQVSHCRISKIEFHAMKLSTFVYKGQWLPIDLSQSSELKSVYIWWLRDNPSKFSQLRYLQLCLPIQQEDVDKILSVASFLVAAPFLRKLVVHLSGPDLCPKGDWPETENLRRLPQCQYEGCAHYGIYRGEKGHLNFCYT